MARTRKIGLHAIVGCMFSGKTEEVVKILSVRTKHSHQKVLAFTPKIDTRSENGLIASKNGAKFPAFSVGEASEIIGLVEKDTDLVAIDEAQFFGPDIVRVCEELMQKYGIRSSDYRG